MSFSEESLEDKIAKAMAAISTPVTPLNSGSRKAPTLLTSSKSVGAVNLPSEDVDITDSFSSKKNVSFNDLPKAEHHSDESVRASQSDGNLATSSAESDSGFAMPSLEPVQKPKAITSRTIRRSKSENSTGADSPNPDNSESSTNVTPSNPESPEKHSANPDMSRSEDLAILKNIKDDNLDESLLASPEGRALTLESLDKPDVQLEKQEQIKPLPSVVKAATPSTEEPRNSVSAADPTPTAVTRKFLIGSDPEVQPEPSPVKSVVSDARSRYLSAIQSSTSLPTKSKPVPSLVPSVSKTVVKPAAVSVSPANPVESNTPTPAVPAPAVAKQATASTVKNEVAAKPSIEPAVVTESVKSASTVSEAPPSASKKPSKTVVPTVSSVTKNRPGPALPSKYMRTNTAVEDKDSTSNDKKPEMERKVSLPVDRSKSPEKKTPAKSTPSTNSNYETPKTEVSKQSDDTEQSLIERPVKVAVRVRPFTAYEQQHQARRTISMSGDKLIIVNPNAFEAEPDTIAAAAVAMNNKQWANVFKFDECLYSYTSVTNEEKYSDQLQVHEALGNEIVDNVLNGVSACCFAYGHTGTGKTFSLFGKPGSDSSTSINRHEKSPNKQLGNTINSQSGLIQRVFSDVIDTLSAKPEFGKDIRVFVSFLEIYNEKLRDLLVDGSHIDNESLKIRENPVYGPFVEDLTKIEVFTAEDALRLVAKGFANRTSTKTAWNAQSSRSHAVVTLEITPTYISPTAIPKINPFKGPPSSNSKTSDLILQSALGGTPSKRTPDHKFARVQMVDLAGSEKDSIYKEEEETNQKLVFGGRNNSYNDAATEKEKKELKTIRRSLSTLGYIINSLGKGVAFKSLPYRDSVLTFLLRDALNGRSFTTMLATISPAHFCYEETLSTLRYAERLCLVRSRPSGWSSSSSPYALVAPQQVIREQRKSLLDEFTKIHEDLGLNKPGTNASRQLLHQTIVDPRQRIAKMTKLVYKTERRWNQLPECDEPRQILDSEAGMAKSNNNRNVIQYTNPMSGLTKNLYDVSPDDLEELKNSYRDLQNQLIELQIDLDSVRTDRDSLNVELREARDLLGAIEKTKSESKASVLQLTKSLKIAEQELTDLRNILRRKEDTIDRLMSDLADEKESKANAEQTFHLRTKEFMTRYDTLKRENLGLHKDLEEAYDKCEYFTKENEELKQQLERLTNAFDEQKKARESMLQQVEDFDKDNTYLRARITQLENELEQLQQFEKINIELRIIIERHEHDIKLLEEEKLSLKQMLEQKDSLLKILSQQSEQSVKMLHQRQEAIEKLENHPYNGIDIEEYLRLQSNLKEVFISEGELLHSEYLDAKRLISIVRELREQIHQNEQLKSEISIQREDKRQVNEKFQHNIQRIDKLEQTKSDLISQLQSMKRELDDCYYKINHLEGKNLMQESNSSPLRLEMNRQYDIRSSSNNNYNSSFSYNNSSYSSSNVNNNYQFEQQIQTIQSENSILREQLLISQKETVQARDELKIAQGKMQREFSSLYLSVQELNKLDAMKDKSIQDLISDRDRAIIERDIAREKYTVLAKEHKEIQQELHDIDLELMTAVEAEQLSGGENGRKSRLITEQLRRNMHTRKDLLAKGLQRSDSNNYAEDIDGADSAYDYRKSAIKPQRNGRQPDSISPLSTSTTGRVRPVSFNNNNSRFSDFGNDDYYDELSEKVLERQIEDISGLLESERPKYSSGTLATSMKQTTTSRATSTQRSVQHSVNSSNRTSATTTATTVRGKSTPTRLFN